MNQSCDWLERTAHVSSLAAVLTHDEKLVWEKRSFWEGSPDVVCHYSPFLVSFERIIVFRLELETSFGSVGPNK